MKKISGKEIKDAALQWLESNEEVVNTWLVANKETLNYCRKILISADTWLVANRAKIHYFYQYFQETERDWEQSQKMTPWARAMIGEEWFSSKQSKKAQKARNTEEARERAQRRANALARKRAIETIKKAMRDYRKRVGGTRKEFMQEIKNNSKKDDVDASITMGEDNRFLQVVYDENMPIVDIKYNDKTFENYWTKAGEKKSPPI